MAFTCVHMHIRTCTHTGIHHSLLPSLPLTYSQELRKPLLWMGVLRFCSLRSCLDVMVPRLRLPLSHHRTPARSSLAASWMDCYLWLPPSAYKSSVIPVDPLDNLHTSGSTPFILSSTPNTLWSRILIASFTGSRGTEETGPWAWWEGQPWIWVASSHGVRVQLNKNERASWTLVFSYASWLWVQCDQTLLPSDSMPSLLRWTGTVKLWDQMKPSFLSCFLPVIFSQQWEKSVTHTLLPYKVTCSQALEMKMWIDTFINSSRFLFLVWICLWVCASECRSL